MRGTDVQVSDNLHENRIHGTEDFPIQYYEDMLHTFWNRSVPIHWHEEVEFFTVLKGSVTLQVMDKQLLLSDGQSGFINSNVLHGLYMPSTENECLMPNIVFSPELISPAASSIFHNYVLPFIRNKSLPYLILNRDSDWSLCVSGLLESIYAVFRSMDKASALTDFSQLDIFSCDFQISCPEMVIHDNISKIWQLFYTNCHVNTDINIDVSSPVSETRIQKMLKFIQDHYGEPITLNQISASADVGKSEATRCFQKYLRKSPVEYLLDYRIERAAELLDNPHYSIQGIAELCGFRDNGYFSKTFRKKTGVSPQEFRRKITDNL